MIKTAIQLTIHDMSVTLTYYTSYVMIMVILIDLSKNLGSHCHRTKHDAQSAKP